MGAIYIYQMIISPIIGPKCRYYPSCSNYMLITLKMHGLLKGFALGVARIIRCNGLFVGGIDYPCGYNHHSDDKCKHSNNRKTHD